MVRRSRDSKFIIYQVLYIFVITVLALKGAEINLGEVVSKENVVKKTVRDSLVNVVDSLSEMGLKLSIKVDTNVIVENKILKNELSKLNNQVVSLTNKIKDIPKKRNTPKEEKLLAKVLQSPFSTNKSFLKYATNSAENKSTVNVELRDPKTDKLISVIPPNEIKEFELRDEDEIVLKYGNKTEKIKTTENLPPEIVIDKVTTKMSKANIYVKELQRTTCFNVKISDERLDQIRITHSGPISVAAPRKDKKGNLVYTVSLNLVNNEDKFYEWIDANNKDEDADGRYKVNFFFSAFDTKSKQKVEVGESFYFTEYTK